MWIAHHTEHNNSPHLWLEPIAAADCGQVPASLVTAFAWAVLLPQDFAFKCVSPACWGPRLCSSHLRASLALSRSIYSFFSPLSQSILKKNTHFYAGWLLECSLITPWFIFLNARLQETSPTLSFSHTLGRASFPSIPLLPVSRLLPCVCPPTHINSKQLLCRCAQ